MSRTPEEIHALYGTDPDWRNISAEQPAEPQQPSAAAAPSATIDTRAGEISARQQEIHERYGTDPNWRTAGMVAEEEDNYGWGITTALMRGITRLRALPDIAQGDYEELAGHFGDLEQYQLSERDQQRMAELEETEGLWEAIGYYLRNPTLVGQVVAESLPMMVAPIAGGFGGGFVGSAAGPVGTAGGAMAGVGVGSYATEYYNSVGEFFQREGVDMTNPQQLQAAFNNPELMANARAFAKDRGIPIAVFDALSMGLAGRIGKPVAGLVKGAQPGAVRSAVGRAAGGTAEMGMQAGFGMAGEAGAQLSAEGEITSWAEVAAEGLGEIVPGMAEAGVSAYLRRRDAAKRAGIADPNESPLSALDVADEGQQDGWTDIAATDIDPVTGEVVTRTGDPLRDALDVQLEDALLDLEMTREAEALAGDLDRAAETKPESVGMLEQAAFEEREAQEAAERQRQEEEAYRQQADQIVAQDEAEAVPPQESEMVTPRGVPVEQEPIDVIGGQPAEGMATTEGTYETGGRPPGTSLGEALREAGVRRAVQTTPRDQGPLPPPSTPPEIAPEPSPLDIRAAEQLELDQQAEENYPDIPFTDEEIAARRPPKPPEDDEGGPPGGEPPPPPPTSMAVEKPKPEPEITEAVAEPLPPDTPKPTKRPNYARDNFLTTRAKLPAKSRLSMEKFEAEGLDIADMREKVYGGKPAFSRHPDAWGPDDVAEFLNEQNYPNPFENGSVGTWDANMALEAIRDEMAGVSEILTGQGIETRATEQRYQDELDAAERARTETQEDMFGAPSETAQAIADRERERQARERAAPEADTGALDDLFTAQQTQEQSEAQVDVEEMAVPETPEGFAVRETSREDLDALADETAALIDKFAEMGEKNMGWDRSEILSGVQKLKLHEHPRAAELEARANEVLQAPEVGPGGDVPEEVSEGRQESIDSGHVAYVENLRAKNTAEDSLVADIEDQNEAWRIFRAYEEELTWAADLPQDEVRAQNTRIDRLAELGDKRAMKLAQDVDHWMHKERIQAKSSHEQFKKSRKSNKYGGITDIRSRNQISLDAAQLSWTVPYDTLTFQTPEDQARADRILEVGEKAEAATPPETPPETPPSTEPFVLNEDRFGQEGLDTEERVFSAVPPIDTKKRVAIDTRLKREGNQYITPEQAEERLDAWENNAIQQGKASRSGNRGPQSHKDNFNRVIISLFDATGKWANPYALAGYDVRALDIKSGIDVTDFSVEFMDQMFGNFDGKEIYGIIAACPCTTFSNSSTKWRRSDLPPDHPQNRHENADPEYSRKWIEEMWGKKAAEAVDEDGNPLYATPHDYAIALVTKTIQTLEYFRPKFWAVENPEGRIEEAAGLPNPWRTGFQPHNFGDPYTKRTLLWGNFNDNLPTANVDPVEGSKMHKMSPSEERQAMRSETPEGFALAFFQANNYLDTDPVERTKKDYWYLEGAIEEAFRAGVTEDQIRENVYLDDSYDPESAEVDRGLATLRRLIDEAQGGPSPTTPGTPPTTPPPRTPAGIGYQLEVEIMSKSPAELAKRDKVDLQAIAMRLGLDEKGSKIEIAKRIKDEVASIKPAPTEAEIEAAEAQTVEPSEAQAEAGNYKTPPVELPGNLIFRMETAEGVKRKGYKQAHPYGYFEGTKAADGDPLDAFINKKMAEDWEGDVYIVDQQFPGVGGFDEHKVMFGFNNMMDARRGYKASYGKDWKGTGPVTKMSLGEFKAWLAEPGALKKPAALSKVAEKGKKARGKQGKDLKYASGRDLLNAPNNLFVKKILEGGERKTGDIPDTMPLQMAVSELLKIQEQAAADPIQKFVDWFGNSKVVDEAGQPLVVYHGTDQGFDVFSAEARGSMTGAQSAKEMFWFASKIDTAKYYSKGQTGNIETAWRRAKHMRTPGPSIKSVYLSMQNPLIHDFKGKVYRETSYAELVERAKAGGHDGLILKNTYDAGEYSRFDAILEGKFKGETIYAVFEPSQIKTVEQVQRESAPAARPPDFGELEQALRPIEDSLPGAPITLLHNYKQAPLPVVKAMQDRGMTQVKAVFDPETGQIYMFANQIGSIDEGVRTGLHEKAHRGLREAFGERLNPLLDDIYKNANDRRQVNMNTIVDRYNIDVETVEGRREAAEELLAHMAEHDVSDGIVNRAVAFIRRILRDLGFVQEFTDNDIRGIIREAQGAISRRGNRIEGITLEEEVVVEGSEEIYVVEQDADVVLTGIQNRIEICKKLRKCL